MNKITLTLLVVCYSIIGLFDSCHSATNLAFGKAYTAFPLPNYSLSALPNDVSSLTDGKYTDGYFWTNRSTVGWQNSGPVEVVIDLGAIFTIDNITFNTARSSGAEVDFPAQVAAFAGPDTEHLLYIGDIVMDPGNVSGAYQVKKFTLNDVNTKARYIVLVMNPKGPYLFCDEIEVHEGTLDKGVSGNLTREDARKLAETLKRVSLDKVFLSVLVNELRPIVALWPQIALRLEDIGKRIEAADATPASMESVENDIFGIRGELIRAQHPGEEFIVSVVNPWSKVSPVYPVTGPSGAHVDLFMPVDGFDQAAFTITNIAENTQRFSLSFADTATDVSEISLYYVPFVKSASNEFVADPLVPLKEDITLRSGESRMFMLNAKGRMAGTRRGNLKVVCGSTETLILVDCRVAQFTLSMKQTLNAVNWNYLNFKPVRDNKLEAMKDLFAHHTNTVVIAPWQLALADQPSAQALVLMNQAFELEKGAEKVLLFMNFGDETLRTVGGKYTFLSDEWKAWFHRWYESVAKAAEMSGFTREQLYFYPYDEVSVGELDNCIAFATWVHLEIPGSKLYATLDHKESERLLPYLNIAQISYKFDFTTQTARDGTDLWIYSADRLAKSLSPYSHYRLMSWEAFLDGFKGVGFWAYADTGWGDNPGTAWDDFDGNYPDFAVIYEGPDNSIISSRRWEAWRMGIEDYELLTMYAKSKGDGAAKAFAQDVFDNPGDTTRADIVRHKIISALSGEQSEPPVINRILTK